MGVELFVHPYLTWATFVAFAIIVGIVLHRRFKPPTNRHALAEQEEIDNIGGA